MADFKKVKNNLLANEDSLKPEFNNKALVGWNARELRSIDRYIFQAESRKSFKFKNESFHKILMIFYIFIRVGAMS